MFKIKDGRSKFYMWDLDRKLIVEDETITQVHFCNRTDECSLVVETYKEDGLTVANVPNVLLQTDWDINVYAYDGNYTKHSARFEVERRTKPTDYVYTETEVLNWETIQNKLDAATEELSEEINNSLAKTEEELTKRMENTFYDVYPTETQSGDIIYTDIGANGVPVKSLTATVSSGSVPVTLTVKQMGKNIFNSQSVILLYGKRFNFETGELETNGIACCSEQYFAVLPNTDYTFSGVAIKGTGYASRAYFYDANKNYLGYKASPYDASLVFTTPVNCYWVRFVLPQYVHSKYTGSTATDPAEGAVGTIRSNFKTQLEFGAETPYEAYTEKTYSINIDELDTSAEVAEVKTELGINTFEIERIDGVSATMDITYRVDSTLAFNKLKAAVVAAAIN